MTNTNTGPVKKKGPTMDKAVRYSIHDGRVVLQLLEHSHKQAEATAHAYELKYGLKYPLWDLSVALKSAARRYKKHCGGTSKYSPHQGKREKLRRSVGGFYSQKAVFV